MAGGHNPTASQESGVCVKHFTTTKETSYLPEGLLPSQRWANTIQSKKAQPTSNYLLIS